MQPLLSRRVSLGLSQRELARRAGIAYKTIQLLEGGGRSFRWSTLTKLARALRLPGPESLLPSRASSPDFSASAAAERIIKEGEETWKLPLFEFVDAFRRAPGPALTRRAPDPELAPRPLALLASTVEALCAEQDVPAPWWCAGVPALPEPWFVAGAESLKVSALAESPAAFRRRNIFVLANFLSRA